MLKEKIYLNATYASRYDNEKYGSTFGELLEQQEVETYLDLLDDTDQSILDVGAGTGKLSVVLLQLSKQVVALDASPQMLGIAVKKARSRGYRLETVVGDAEILAFEDEMFDCVVSSRLMMHLTQWRRAVAEFCRVARNTVVLDFPPILSSGGIGALSHRVIRLWSPSIQAYRVYSIRSIAREFHSNGFLVTDVRRQYCLPVTIHRLLNQASVSNRIEGLCSAVGLTRLVGAPVTIKAVRSHQRES